MVKLQVSFPLSSCLECSLRGNSAHKAVSTPEKLCDADRVK